MGSVSQAQAYAEGEYVMELAERSLLESYCVDLERALATSTDELLFYEKAAALDQRCLEGLFAQRFGAAGADPMQLQRGLMKASKLLAEEVKKVAVPVDEDADIQSVATIATGSEAMGRTIASCFKRVGKNGATMVEDGQTLVDEIEFTEGMELDRGYISGYFVSNQELQACQMERPRVLVTDKKINFMNELVGVLEPLVKSREPLLIIADDVQGEALQSLVLNSMRGVLDVCAIKSPGFGNRRTGYLEDIATTTGATFITEQLGLSLKEMTVDMLGTAERVSITKERTTMISTGKHSDEVNERIEVLKADMAATDSDFDQEKLQERIAKLGGAIGRIKVGAATETELKDKKLRYEDALNSVKAAMEEGIVPGGGACLVYLSRKKEEIAAQMDNDEQKLAVDILFRAIEAPIIQIGDNAGVDGAVVLEEVKGKDFGYGYNAATDEYEDLLKAGVIDPALVTMEALINSSSIASSVITTSALITEIPEEEPMMGMPGGDPYGGGMPGY